MDAKQVPPERTIVLEATGFAPSSSRHRTSCSGLGNLSSRFGLRLCGLWSSQGGRLWREIQILGALILVAGRVHLSLLGSYNPHLVEDSVDLFCPTEFSNFFILFVFDVFRPEFPWLLVLDGRE